MDYVSAGATPDDNEDRVAVFTHGAVTDLVIVDGGTSVAERDYAAPDEGDVVWFARRFCTALEPAIHAGLDQHDAVHDAVATVHAEFLALTAGIDVPDHAWPIGALTWIRLAAGRARLYCLGDCTALLGMPDGAVVDLDPFVNPQEAVLQAAVAQLKAQGITDAAARHARLLPMLRARRVHQNAMAQPAVLCLRPHGPFAARRHDHAVPPGAAVLGMTDGFYRLVDTYGLHTPASLMDLCTGRGLAAALAQLREHERAMAGGVTVKRADDASAVLWRAE